MLTRSKKLIRAKEYAKKAILSEIVAIRSSKELRKFLEHSQLNEQVASVVQVFAVELHATNATFPHLRTILSLLHGITDLVMNIPVRYAAHLSSALHFANLTSLSTTLPHSMIATLLHNHPRITTLVLGPCSTPRKCPLRAIQLPEASELSGPPGCLAGLVGNNPVREVTATYRGPRDAQYPLHLLFNFMPLNTSVNLTVLHVDFRPSDVDMLLRVAAAAPRLVSLKLTENIFLKPADHLKARLLWREPSKWVEAFNLLPCLQNLLLKTFHSLAYGADDEAETIRRWLSVVKPMGTHPHPALRHIVVWWSAEIEGGCLGVWDLVNGLWSRTYAATAEPGGGLDEAFV
ncbi:hypothetical protein BV25DRAFT_1921950 [Artomyces pyxidatus]|uniref:Uncharacterized protein n=1 Tax=Artomyces pyxidatus TaxID=48021 RepID=A0ACB8SGC8_9AGAM|nr:hypothetical protein BV25DRAFT_1921950 [Artomyces pyxidatus]